MSTRNALAVAQLAEFPEAKVLYTDEQGEGVTVAQLRASLASDEREEDDVRQLIEHVDKKLADHQPTQESQKH